MQHTTTILQFDNMWVCQVATIYRLKPIDIYLKPNPSLKETSTQTKSKE